MEERHFYHSFPRPRRGAEKSDEIAKGCAILASMRNLGLVLSPEYISWKQPLSDGKQRSFPRLQTRACFTELSPTELPEHAATFGRFALEFEVDVLRNLGAIPVFYIPQPIDDSGGNALGVALFAIAMDANAVIHRLASLAQVLDGLTPGAEEFDFNVGFADSPERRGKYKLRATEVEKFLRAVGHGATPWVALGKGVDAMLNFFYPADDVHRNKILHYYRQREWRIACRFAVKGAEVLRAPTDNEKRQLLEIDGTFWGQNIQTGLGITPVLEKVLIHPGLNGRRLIEMARRVIVPKDALERVRAILAELTNPPRIETLEALHDLSS